MKFSILIFSLITLLSCKNDLQTKTPTTTKTNYSLATVEIALEITSKIENNQNVSQTEWDELFSSKGYHNYFCAFGREHMEPKLKKAYHLVFDKTQSKALDSILKAPVTMDESGQYTMIVKNLNSFKTNREGIKQFMMTTDFDQLLVNAKAQTSEYLPQFAKDTIVDLHELNFVLMEPNAYVTDCGIVVDINHAFEDGPEKLQSLFAHEFHHNFRNAFLSLPNDPLMNQLNGLHAEAIADFIDKETPPWKELKGYPQGMLDEFNDSFKNTPEKLKELDSLTSYFVEGQTTKEDFDASMNRFFQDGGHANGFYMSIKIVEAGLKQQMIETFNNPIAFIKLYNKAVHHLPTEYILSDTFVDYIMQLQANHENYVSTLSDETYQVTFKVKVPRAEDEVYIVGNQEALGDWKPDVVKLNVISPLEREITLNTASPAEFKFTRGEWNNQAIFGNSQDNLKLEFKENTTTTYTIEKWMDSPELK